MGWELLQSRQRLAGQLRRLALFAHCGRQELSYLTKWADVVAVPAGQELVREGSGGFWMFVLLEGRVDVVAKGRAVGALGPGEEMGHESLVGFRPHPFTATARTACILLVLRPRFALSLLTMGGGIQRHLYPALAPAGFAAHFDTMLEQGRREWGELQALNDRQAHPRQRSTGRTTGTALLVRPTAPASVLSGTSSARDHAQGPEGPAGDHRLSSERLAGRRLSLAEAAAVVARMPPTGPVDHGMRPLVRVAPPWLWPVLRRASLALAAAVCALVLCFYHPPRYAITAGGPIDVASDVTISGAPVHPLRGHLLLLWVRARQPNLAGFVWDAVTGVTTVGIDPASGSSSARATAYASGRRQYLQSQQVAIRLAEAAAGVNEQRVEVRIVDRGFVGPSAGLVYGLAVYDLLTGAGPADGRVVAATGSLAPDGSVGAVGWVSLKAGAVTNGGVPVLLVPTTDYGLVGHQDLRVRATATFRQALADQGRG